VESESHGDALLARVLAFCLPGGDAPARLVKSIRITEQGEMRASPTARWIPFTAEQVIESRFSSFRWEARMSGGAIGSVTVVDAYEAGHGRPSVRKGPVPLKQITGPDADKSELQRYLASIMFCPPALVNHSTLEWTSVGAVTLRVHDRQDATGAWVDLIFGEDGSPLGCRADRPRMAGRRMLSTPWSAICAELREHDGLRVPHQLEGTWHLLEGPFTYYRSQVTSFVALRA
jgi:hypothetical protein